MMVDDKQLSSETQAGCDNPEARFKWVPAAGSIANSGFGFSSSAQIMRVLARRFQEVASLLDSPSLTPTRLALAQRHLLKAWQAVLRTGSSGIPRAPIIAWLMSATIAFSHSNCAQILQLVKVADKAAKRDEAESWRAKI